DGFWYTNPPNGTYLFRSPVLPPGSSTATCGTNGITGTAAAGNRVYNFCLKDLNNRTSTLYSSFSTESSLNAWGASRYFRRAQQRYFPTGRKSGDINEYQFGPTGALLAF